MRKILGHGSAGDTRGLNGTGMYPTRRDTARQIQPQATGSNYGYGEIKRTSSPGAIVSGPSTHPGPAMAIRLTLDALLLDSSNRPSRDLHA